MPISVSDEREHRRGLVLGLTLAEVLLLLLFLLLLALAARLHELEQEKRAVLQEKQELVLERDRLAAESATGERLVTGSIDTENSREFEVAHRLLTPIITVLKSDASKYEATAAAISLAARINPDDPPAVLQRGLTVLEVIGPATPLKEISALVSNRRESDAKTKALGVAGPGKHNWPPIITLSEANGYFFETGSAELSSQFRSTLTGSVVSRLLETVKEFDVDVIEVIGHTDEQRIVERPSNLDKILIPFLQEQALTERFVPADNAGLGLARAAAVVRVLGNDPRLAGLRILPFSGGQLVDVGDRRADGASSGDMRERRRIEIRVRRSDKAAVSKTSGSVEMQHRQLPPRRQGSVSGGQSSYRSGSGGSNQ